MKDHGNDHNGDHSGSGATPVICHLLERESWFPIHADVQELVHLCEERR